MNYNQKVAAILAETVENLKALDPNPEFNGAVVIMASIPTEDEKVARHTVAVGKGPSIATAVAMSMVECPGLEGAIKVAQKALPLAKILNMADEKSDNPLADMFN